MKTWALLVIVPLLALAAGFGLSTFVERPNPSTGSSPSSDRPLSPPEKSRNNDTADITAEPTDENPPEPWDQIAAKFWRATQRLKFELAPESGITGQITDIFGRPMVNSVFLYPNKPIPREPEPVQDGESLIDYLADRLIHLERSRSKYVTLTSDESGLVKFLPPVDQPYDISAGGSAISIRVNGEFGSIVRPGDHFVVVVPSSRRTADVRVTPPKGEYFHRISRSFTLAIKPRASLWQGLDRNRALDGLDLEDSLTLPRGATAITLKRFGFRPETFELGPNRSPRLEWTPKPTGSLRVIAVPERSGYGPRIHLVAYLYPASPGESFSRARLQQSGFQREGLGSIEWYTLPPGTYWVGLEVLGSRTFAWTSVVEMKHQGVVIKATLKTPRDVSEPKTDSKIAGDPSPARPEPETEAQSRVGNSSLIVRVPMAPGPNVEFTVMLQPLVTSGTAATLHAAPVGPSVRKSLERDERSAEFETEIGQAYRVTLSERRRSLPEGRVLPLLQWRVLRKEDVAVSQPTQELTLNLPKMSSIGIRFESKPDHVTLAYTGPPQSEMHRQGGTIVRFDHVPLGPHMVLADFGSRREVMRVEISQPTTYDFVAERINAARIFVPEMLRGSTPDRCLRHDDILIELRGSTFGSFDDFAQILPRIAGEIQPVQVTIIRAGEKVTTTLSGSEADRFPYSWRATASDVYWEPIEYPTTDR